MALGDDLARPPLVRRIEEREQEADRDRLDARRRPARRPRARPSSRRAATSTSPVGRHALRHLLAQRAGREEHRRLGLEDEVVHLVPHLAADLEHVLEALGREQADLRALALEHGVGGDRGAVHEADDLVRPTRAIPAACSPSHAFTPALGLRRVVGILTRRITPLAVATDDVGEGAADVDADLELPCCCHHHHHLRVFRFLPRCTGSPDRSTHPSCLADFTITTFGFRFRHANDVPTVES